jgi:hypothetical protein
MALKEVSNDYGEVFGVEGYASAYDVGDDCYVYKSD